ncbi:glycosyltransferase [Kineococcus gypseus]|uniref:glycosyltransferase n=1 Tax=Kineococcus gypseus TaxID=1637102 RepID=UPI003D7C7384
MSNSRGTTDGSGSAPGAVAAPQGPAPLLVLQADAGSARRDDVTAAVLAAVRDALARTGGRAAGGRAPGGAYVLVRLDGRPLTAVDVRLPLTADRVAAAVARSSAHSAVGDGAPAAPAVPRPPLRLPSATVVVPTVVARVEELRRCLQGLARLDHPDAEVVLVDNRPRRPAVDPLEELLREHPGVRVVREAVPGISAARNAGLRAARGEVVAFTDDDVTVDPGWLSAIARRFAQSPAEEAVTGLVLPAELETAAQQRYERHYGGFGGPRSFVPVSLHPARDRRGRVRRGLVDVRSPEGERLRTIAVYGVGAYGAGANVAFRTDGLRARGGFDVALGTGTPTRGGEDLAAFVHVLGEGWALGYEPTAVVHHTHRREDAELERQLVGNGTGFTAMLTSLVLHDPAHLLSLAALGPGAAATMARQTLRRLLPGRARRAGGPAGPAVPAEPAGPAVLAEPPAPRDPAARRMVVLELGGMLRGPAAYLRSRRAHAARGAALPLAAGGAA